MQGGNVGCRVGVQGTGWGYRVHSGIAGYTMGLYECRTRMQVGYNI